MNVNSNISNIEALIDIGPKLGISEWQSSPFQVLKSSSSVVIGLFPFQRHLIIVKMNGDILIVDDEQLRTETAQPSAKVYLPLTFISSITSSCNKTLEYAEFDPKTGTIFYTMASKVGILSTPLLRNGVAAFLKSAASTTAGQHHVVLDVFVRNVYDHEREFWGMAVDSDRRLLYCCNRQRKSSIGAWRLDDGRQLADYGLNDFQPYPFLQCCAISRRNRALVVSSSPWQRILLFDNNNCQDEAISKTFRFVATIAGKIKKRHSDPVKFVINPLGMAFDSFGNLVVADCGCSRIQIFCPSGDGDLTNLSGEWLSEKLWSSPRCVAVGLCENSPTIFAGLHNGDVGCFKNLNQKKTQ